MENIAALLLLLFLVCSTHGLGLCFFGCLNIDCFVFLFLHSNLAFDKYASKLLQKSYSNRFCLLVLLKHRVEL